VEFALGDKRPKVHPGAYIAPTAVLIGDVEVHSGASVWFGAVLRGDESKITVGEGANVQDNAVIHCAEDLPTVIEENATVGHAAQHRAKPDAGSGLDLDVADENRGGGDVGVGVHPRALVAESEFHCAL